MTNQIREGEPPPPGPQAPPTTVRYAILAMAVAVAVLLYLDRFCLSTTDRDIKSSLELSEEQMALVLGAFFLPYALGQLPFGYLADRFGARRMLTAYMVIWSVLTGLMGCAVGLYDLLLYRLGIGLFESGAYPACAGMIKRWIPLHQRGLASGIISLGGRIGGTITPKLTALLMVGGAAVLPEVASWRPVFFIYGTFGVLLAVVFFWIHRDDPAEHPKVNAAERELILANREKIEPNIVRSPNLFVSMLKNRSLWIASFYQFGVNFGWVFLLTYLNRYLQEVHAADRDARGTMNSIVIGMSVPSLILGGLLTDWLTRRHGRRWGRALPLGAARLVAASLYGLIAVLSVYWTEPSEERVWTFVLLLGCVAFCSDLPLPAIWAINMDIGAKNVGVVLGWGNMWGNLGAFVSPMLLNQVVNRHGWTAVFVVCAGVFAVIGVAAFFIDSTETLPE